MVPDAPHEWVFVVAAIAGTSAIVIGGTWRILVWMQNMAREHIDTRVDVVTKERLDERIGKVEADLGAVLVNVAEVGAAVGRVYVMEKKIDNGLEVRLRRVENMVAELVGRLRGEEG
jgi:hypothetical protein